MDLATQVHTARRYVAELQAKYGLSSVEELELGFHPAAADLNEWRTDILAWRLWLTLERRALLGTG